MNRGYQSFDLIKRVMNNAKKCKFKRINVDLMIGLYGENAKTVVKSFRQVVAALKLDSISVYPLQIPEEEYLEKFYKTKKEFNKELENKLKSFFVLIKPIALKYNYIHFPHFFKKSDAYNFVSKEYAHNKEAQFLYKYDDTKKIDCFGLGIGSYSYIFGSLRYQNIGKDFYLTKIWNPKEKIYIIC